MHMTTLILKLKFDTLISLSMFYFKSNLLEYRVKRIKHMSMSEYLQIALLKALKLCTTAKSAYFMLFNGNLCNITQAILAPLPICIIY